MEGCKWGHEVGGGRGECKRQSTRVSMRLSPPDIIYTCKRKHKHLGKRVPESKWGDKNIVEVQE